MVRDITNEATIVTVSTPFHKRLLYYNYQFTKALNPGDSTPWIMVNNPEIHISRQRIRDLLDERGIAHNQKTYRRMLFQEQRRYHDPVKLHEYIGGERILGGLSLADVAALLPQSPPDETETQEQFDYRKDKVLQSYHHAFNLELALSKVKTRFAIVLDPDLYVVRRDWVRDIVDHMKEAEIAVFGVPWNPRYFQKFRYFPATHFMVIDFDVTKKKNVVLKPDLMSPQSKFEPKFWRKYFLLEKKIKSLARLYLVRNLQEAILEDISQRRMIGKSRDSGYLFFEACSRLPNLKVETVSPVYDLSDGFIPPTVSHLQRELDDKAFSVEEDHLSYLPKKEGYIAQEGFKASGYPDFRAFGWEEFVWKDVPFAFHIRGEVHRARVGDVDEPSLLDGLNAMLARHGNDSVTASPAEKLPGILAPERQVG